MIVFPHQTSRSLQHPVVVRMAPDGIAGMLRRNRDKIATSLEQGRAVALVEVRGSGATSASADFGQQAAITAQSATALILGRNLLAEQLRDLRAAWRHLASNEVIDRTKVSIFGDSPIQPLRQPETFSYPRRTDGRPSECLPQASLLALLLALFEDEVSSVECSGGLVSFRTVLDSPFVQVPHSCIVPGMLREGDVPDLVAALLPRQITLGGLVDGTGRAVSLSESRKELVHAIQTYMSAGQDDKLNIVDE
jgi:hypothetical protein